MAINNRRRQLRSPIDKARDNYSISATYCKGVGAD